MKYYHRDIHEFLLRNFRSTFDKYCNRALPNVNRPLQFIYVGGQVLLYDYVKSYSQPFSNDDFSDFSYAHNINIQTLLKLLIDHSILLNKLEISKLAFLILCYSIMLVQLFMVCTLNIC